MSASRVRRDKAALSSGCNPHPATAPAGSNRSSQPPRPIPPSHGDVRVKRRIQWRMCKTPALFRYPRSEPDCAIWSFPGQIKLTFGRRSRRPHQYPACGGRGSGGRHHSLPRLFRPCRGSVRPPGSARTDQVLEDLKIVERLSSGVFHYGSLDNDAGGDIFPQRDQQLTRQRHDGRLFEAAAIAADPLFEPQSQRRLRLMAQP